MLFFFPLVFVLFSFLLVLLLVLFLLLPSFLRSGFLCELLFFFVGFFSFYGLLFLFFFSSFLFFHPRSSVRVSGVWGVASSSWAFPVALLYLLFWGASIWSSASVLPSLCLFLLHFSSGFLPFGVLAGCGCQGIVCIRSSR